MHPILIAFVLLIITAATGVLLYNQLVGLRQMAMNGWADIEIQTVPANLIAGPFGFRQRSFFELATSDAALPKLDFNQ